MSNLQPNCFFFKFDFQKMDQHAGYKWLIHDTKRRNKTFNTVGQGVPPFVRPLRYIEVSAY